MSNFFLEIRTPRELVASLSVRGIRVPTESGQAGIRPRMEACMLSLVPGLVLLSADDGLRYCATAGGLLDVMAGRTKLLTPFAVVGDAPDKVLAALDAALTSPSGDLAVRRRLAELEQRIVRELHARPGSGGERFHD